MESYYTVGWTGLSLELIAGIELGIGNLGLAE